MRDHEMKDMLIEYMGKGFLDNIIALFKEDPLLYRFVPDMIGNENIRVRLGATALVEELAELHRDQAKAAVPGLVALLKDENPTIRGDAASVLGVIGDGAAREALMSSLEDSHPGVRESARDALSELGRRL